MDNVIFVGFYSLLCVSINNNLQAEVKIDMQG